MAEDEARYSGFTSLNFPDANLKFPHLWHEDGDILLSVSENGKTYNFRVHGPILSVHSPVLRNMFQLDSTSQSPNEKSCPTIKLHDPVEGLNVFLWAFYRPFEFFEVDELNNFDDILALFTLSHKYQVKDMQAAMTGALKARWPLNFRQYRGNFELIDFQRIQDCIRVINAARLTNVAQLLPTAFYELALSKVEEWRSSDLKEQLSLEDLSRLMFGRERIIRRMAKLCIANDGMAWILWNKDPQIRDDITSIKEPCLGECPQMHYGTLVCRGVFKNIHFRLGSRLIHGRSLLSALSTPLDNQFLPEDMVCSACSEWAKRLVENKIEEIWHNVPLDFDLPAIDPAEYDEQE